MDNLFKYPYFSKQIDFIDLSVSVSEIKKNGLPVVFIHGFSGSKEDFTFLFSKLSKEGFHPIAYDQRGHGQTKFVNNKTICSLNKLRDDLLKLLEILNIESCVSIGHSMGGIVLQEAIIKEPSKFRAAVFVDTHYGSLNINEDIIEIIDKILKEKGLEELFNIASNLGMFNDTAIKDKDDNFKKQYFNFSKQKFINTHPKIFVPVARDLSQRPSRLTELSKLDIKCLAIAGENDEPFFDPTKNIADTMRTCVFVPIRNAGHLPQFENSEMFYEVLLDFLKTID